MGGQLIPPPEFAPRMPDNATPQQCINAWIDLLRSGDKLLMAGLRRDIGPEGDVRAAYRAWYEDRRQEHDQDVAKMLYELHRREHPDA
jgi:hypothetical protein